jgi:probable rRNA maturation factor
MPVLIQHYLRSVRINEPSLVRVVRAILSAVRESSAELAVTFVGDRRMRRLNREYRNKDCSTDVLAFAMRDAPTPQASRVTPRPVGDVVISIPTAQRQAREGGRSLDEELTVLLVHGILHLCGYDHERSEREARRMQRRERAILQRLGRRPRLVRQKG